MTTIKTVHKDYFQKSLTFLYPMLDIKRGVSVTPIRTFLSWKDVYKVSDRKLICLYYLRKDQEFYKFEKEKLRGNKLFENFKEIENIENILSITQELTIGAYIFNYDEYSQDWEHITQGRYSKLSSVVKEKILNFFSDNRADQTRVRSFLHPEKYLNDVASALEDEPNRKQKLLRSIKEVGELCDLPNLEKETLIAQIKNLEIPQILS